VTTNRPGKQLFPRPPRPGELAGSTTSGERDGEMAGGTMSGRALGEAAVPVSLYLLNTVPSALRINSQTAEYLLRVDVIAVSCKVYGAANLGARELSGPSRPGLRLDARLVGH